MTATRSVESTKYGAKLFAYVLLVVAVGGGLFGLGYTLAWPDIAPGPPPVTETTTVAAGAVLGLLGLFVLGTGLLAAFNKLVADSVAMGISAAGAEEPTPAAAGASSTPDEADSQVPDSAAGGPGDGPSRGTDGNGDVRTGPPPAETSGDSPSESQAAGHADAGGSAAGSPPGESPDAAAEPPEPSPEEIAFGTTDSETGDAEGRDPADDPPESAETVDPAPSAASSDSDPLADPKDEE